jgi:hypothetical protein
MSKNYVRIIANIGQESGGHVPTACDRATLVSGVSKNFRHGIVFS